MSLSFREPVNNVLYLQALYTEPHVLYFSYGLFNCQGTTFSA